MNVLFNLAQRNIFGAGLRTWLNVGALSFGFVLVIWMQGIYQGMLQQMTTLTVDADYGGGQYWQQLYDPYDPLTMDDAHGVPDAALLELIARGEATPVLLTTASIFPNGRAQPASLRGVDPEQTIVNVPTASLRGGSEIPAMIGERMAKDSGLSVGDTLTVRWRDVDGTFDATDVEIVSIMSTGVPQLDGGVLWLRLSDLQDMLGTPDEATLVITAKGYDPKGIRTTEYVFKDLDYLLADERALYMSKQVGGIVVYAILMTMGLLAVFDTQVLAIFRRRKEIGTMMALGMQRSEIVGLFTLEGSMHGVLALAVGAVWGIPLMAYTTLYGIAMPAETVEDMGIAMGTALYTRYAPGLFILTLSILVLSVVIVSFLPARKISKLHATDAIRGKMQ